MRVWNIRTSVLYLMKTAFQETFYRARGRITQDSYTLTVCFQAHALQSISMCDLERGRYQRGKSSNSYYSGQRPGTSTSSSSQFIGCSNLQLGLITYVHIGFLRNHSLAMDINCSASTNTVSWFEHISHSSVTATWIKESEHKAAAWYITSSTKNNCRC